ncbi:MAG: glycoside hydrolase family 6 protein [Terracidiphilus sp.]|jgi:cellulase/cellobiase CelA1
MFKQFNTSWRRACACRLSGYITVLAAILLTLTLSTPGVYAQTHVANPYVGANGYVNPDYATEVGEAIATAPAGSTLATQMSVVATYPTAVWMDHIGAITATTGAHRGLAAHVAAALAQQAASGSSEPVVMEIVIYDLPDRDCAALASNGELSIAGNDTVTINGVATQLTGTGLEEYENDYITPIYNILAANSTNPNIRFALVVEDDSLPNLITNAGLSFGLANCIAANGGVTNSTGTDIDYSGSVYIQGIAYAINQFHKLPNVYTYLDVGHHAWLGWPVNMAAGVTLFKTFATTELTDSYASIDGFITNTANYGAIKEPFLTYNEEVGGSEVYTSGCTSTWCGFQFNPNIDEQDYAANFAAALTTPTTSSYTFVDGSTVAGGGFPSTLGFLIDTSRSGWGSPLRPTAPSTSTVLDTFVQDSMIDLRSDAGNWCNQSNAGLGVPPTATPTPGILAYVWIKPPGEADGNYPGSVYAGTNDGALDGVASTVGDPNCNPTHSNTLANSMLTDAVANSPSAGTFWSSYFTMLVQNALPQVPATKAPGFSLSATGASVEQGTTATSGVSVSAINGFDSAVALTVTGLPAGVTATFSPASVTGSAGSTLTFTASATAVPGTYPLTVTGTSGSTTETATLSLTVVAAPNFTITASSTTVSLPIGTNPTDTFTITFVGGLTGSVSVSATGLPNGLQANFSPNSVNAPGGSIVANFSAQSSTPAGSYPIQIVGTNGTITHSVTITITIPGTGFTLTPSASTVSITQGGTATDTITVTDAGGFTGSVSFAVTGLPSGVTASFSPTSSTSSSVLTLTASSTATIGGATVTVTGTSGSTTASTTFALTVSPSTTPGFTLTPSATSLSVAQGKTGTDTITVADVGGFTGSVSFAATGLPSGVTASFSPASSISSSVLTLTASSTATVGAATVTITGTSGSTTAKTTITLNVTSTTPSFTLAPSAGTLSVTQGKTATDTITVTDVNGFTGSVTFAATGLPSGVTASFSPTSSTSSSVLTFTASATATAGTSTVTITGTSGSTTATTTIALTVAPAGGACTVDYTISPQNSSQFGATISITNGGTTALSNWTLTWTFANGQTISNSWNGAVTQSGANVTVSEQAGQTWENIPAGGSYTGFGFNGTWNGTTNAIPTAFSLNGTACTVN